MTKLFTLTLVATISTILAAPPSHPKGVASNTGPTGNMIPQQRINRRFFGGNGGWGLGGCGGCGGCGFGPVFSENVCCVDENCFHENCFDCNTEAAVFCDNMSCNELDANCFNEFNQDSFFIC